MKAFNGSVDFKNRLLAGVAKHVNAGDIVQGEKFYWDGTKGCAVGCTIHSSDHRTYEKAYQIPTSLAYLKDTIFENLPPQLAQEWTSRFLSAIVPGADLSSVTSQLMVWLLTDPKDGVLMFTTNKPPMTDAIKAVSGLHSAVLVGEEVTKETWSKAITTAIKAADSQRYVMVKINSERAAPQGAGKAWAAAAWSAWAVKAFEEGTVVSKMQAAAAAVWAAVRAAELMVADEDGVVTSKAGAGAALEKSSLHYEKIADKLVALLKSAPMGV